MYANSFFSIWGKQSDGNYRLNYYHADASGALAVNQWIQSGNSKYYYGADGVGYEGIQSLDNKKYYFLAGLMQKNTAVSADGKNYTCGIDGILTEVTKANGWVQNGKLWHYVMNNSFVRNMVAKIGNAYYGFNDNAIMYSDQSFYLNNQELNRSQSYRAKADGSLYVNKWYFDSYGNRYYYGADAAGAYGFATVDGQKLYFTNDGRANKNVAFMDHGISYVAGKDYTVTELKANGWTQINNYWYYTKNNTVAFDQIMQIGNVYYGFDNYGHMYVNTVFSISTVLDNGLHSYIVYSADGNGCVRTNAFDNVWYQTYFFGQDGKGYTGVKNINGINYYFSNGQLTTNQIITLDGKNYASGRLGDLTELANNKWTKVDGNWFYVLNNKALQGCTQKIGNKTYVFDRNGKMAVNSIVFIGNGVYCGADKDGVMLVNAWLKDGNYGDTYAYFGADGKSYSGLQTINGKTYYFSGATYVKNYTFQDKDKLYVADNSGLVHEITKKGWAQFDGNYYYSDGTQLFKNGIYQIGGSLYGFGYNGVMYSNQVFYQNYNGKYSRFYAKKDGALLVNSSWRDSAGKEFYFDAEGYGYQGYHNINGTTYYFQNGEIMKNSVFAEAGAYYVLDSKGQKQSIENNTWKKVDGYYYYVQDGAILKNCVAKIGNAAYAFDEYGRMIANGFHGIEELDEDFVHATASGALTTGWYTDSTGTYYFGKDGIGYTGVHYIDGKMYQFNYGKLV